ncbi:MAG: hypothetical protein QM705_04210 [Ancrocorticia sp.]
MKFRKVTSIAAVVACVVLAGCSQGPDTGTATIEVRTLPTEHSDGVDVTITSDGEPVATAHVSQGDNKELPDIPFGWVKIAADGLCEVETEILAEHPTIRLIVDGIDCALAD